MEPAAAVADRYATGDVEVAGTSIAAGAQVTVSLAGANRDPAEFPDPDRFDLGRPRRSPPSRVRRRTARVHRHGPRAKLEVVTALSALARRFPRLRLPADAPPPTGLVFRKPQRLPVEWGTTPWPRTWSDSR